MTRAEEKTRGGRRRILVIFPSGPRPLVLEWPLFTILASTYYDSASFPRKRRLQYSGYCTNGAIRLFSFLSLSLSLLARRASPVITKLAFNGRATVVVVRRPHLYLGTPEKNVGCMPVGLCHFRRGLSLSFSALFYSALAPPSARTLFFSAVARHRQ